MHFVNGPIEITVNQVEIHGVGKVTVEAWQPGDDNFEAAPDVQQSFVVTEKQSQHLTFDAIDDQVYGALPITFNVASSSELPIVYQVTGPVQYADGLIKIMGVGKASIMAYQSGNEYFAASDTALAAFSIHKATQKITSFELLQQNDSVFHLTAISSAGLPVAFRLVSGQARLERHVLTANGSGIVVAEAYQTGDEYYEQAATVTKEWQVNLITGVTSAKPPVEITIYPNPSRNGYFEFRHLEQTSLEMYQVLDSSGKLLKKGKNLPGSTLDLSAYPSGTYTFIVKQYGKEKQFKLIKL